MFSHRMTNRRRGRVFSLVDRQNRLPERIGVIPFVSVEVAWMKDMFRQLKIHQRVKKGPSQHGRQHEPNISAVVRQYQEYDDLSTYLQAL